MRRGARPPDRARPLAERPAGPSRPPRPRPSPAPRNCPPRLYSALRHFPPLPGGGMGEAGRGRWERSHPGARGWRVCSHPPHRPAAGAHAPCRGLPRGHLSPGGAAAPAAAAETPVAAGSRCPQREGRAGCRGCAAGRGRAGGRAALPGCAARAPSEASAGAARRVFPCARSPPSAGGAAASVAGRERRRAAGPQRRRFTAHPAHSPLPRGGGRPGCRGAGGWGPQQARAAALRPLLPCRGPAACRARCSAARWG